MTKQAIITRLQNRVTKDKGYTPHIMGKPMDLGRRAYSTKGMTRRRIIENTFYRWSGGKREEVEKLVDELIKEGVIEIIKNP